MDIRKRQDSGGVVLELEGEIVPDADESLRKAVDACLDEGHTRITINVEGVPGMDGAGLGEIVRSRSAVARQGGRLEVEGLDERLATVLALTAPPPDASRRRRESRAAHPRDLIWMAWVAVAATVVIVLAALLWP
jgi:anti-sigma B factor antagonist